MMLFSRTCLPPHPSSQHAARSSIVLPAFLVLPLLLLAGAGGCSSSPHSPAPSAAEPLSPQAARLAKLTTAEAAEATLGLSPPTRFAVVDAYCPVPTDWALQPMKEGKNHKHLTWISPTGRTAYGVIFASLPFPAAIVPVSYRLEKVLDFFMSEMKRREGRGELIERRNDYPASLVRFVAEGSMYRIRVNLIVRGSHAWMVYAGTRRDEPVDPQELRIAERARDQTDVGPPKS